MRSTGGDLETEYGQQVGEYALKVLAGWRATREDWEAAQQLRDTSNENARAYAGRFLIELLQNAHDEHPADRLDGTVQFVFDESEGTYGTLYVANGGNPFGLGQVKALCKMSRSSKAIGEGIGHKGIGFRSVLEICDRPEIYSASSAADGPAVLDGYRFRFAEERDLRVLLEDEDEARLAAEEMPPFQVPFPIERVPAACAALADEGMVTVIRLPIYDDAAARNVVARLAELAAAKVPVMLFLRRLGRLVLEHRNGEGTVTRTVLERREQPAPQGDGAGVSLAEVDLGAQGRFTVARHALAPERLHAVVGRATEGNQLDRAWKDWSAPAVAEVAVPAGADGLRRGQVYTFLPLGEDADAPVRAHFNAPFYTKPDRTTLVPGHPLNTLLMQVLAEACLLAAEELRAVGGAPETARAVDLVSWDPHSKWGAGQLDRAAQRLFGSGFADQPLVPCLAADGAGQVWHSPRRARIWPFGTWTVLTAEAAAAIGHAIANPALGQERLQRLARTCEAFGSKLETSPARLAELIEQVAATLPLPAPPEEVVDRSWEEFYQEITKMLPRDGEALRGRRILLSADGALQPCNAYGGAGQEAFFLPGHGAGGVPADLAVPAKLRKRLFYLHPGLRWTDLPGQRGHREARSFLERFDLVRPFDAEGLVEHVRIVLKKSSDKDLRLQALKFVFKLQRSAPSAVLRNSLLNLGLYVPSASGSLIPARTAAFGAGWRGTRGDDLALVIAEGGAECKSLGRFEHRLVAPPDTFVPRGDSVEEWRRFLQSLGVTNGLTPFTTTKGAHTQAMGRDLYPASLVRMANVPAAVAAQWQPHIGSSPVTWNHPQTWYEATGVYRLPGQEIAGRLSEPGRLAYARLVLHGLSHWADSLSIRHRFGAAHLGWRDRVYACSCMWGATVKGVDHLAAVR